MGNKVRTGLRRKVAKEHYPLADTLNSRRQQQLEKQSYVLKIHDNRTLPINKEIDCNTHVLKHRSNVGPLVLNEDQVITHPSKIMPEWQYAKCGHSLREKDERPHKGVRKSKS